jgi:TRAP-type transport system periplasmic protein
MRARRDFIGAASVALGAAGVVPLRAKAAQFEYKAGFNQPFEHPTSVRFTEMAKQVALESGGRLNIRVFPNSILGGEDSMFAQVRLGALEFYIGTSALSSLVPAAEIISVAFAFKSEDVAFAACDGALGANMRKEMEAKGLVVFPSIFGAGFRQITTSTKPIRSADDMVGLKIRTTSGKVYVDLFRTLGAVPVSMALAETYTALQTRTVDSEENAYAQIEQQRFFEVQRYLSVTNHMWNGAWLTANQEKWRALPPDLQAIFSRNARKYALRQRQDLRLLNAAMGEKLQRQGLAFNNVDTQSFRTKLTPAYQRWKADFGPALWTVLEQYSGKLV